MDLTPEDLERGYKGKKLDKVRFYHFNVPYNLLYRAEVVVYKDGDKEVVLKDRYGRMER